MKNKFTLRFTLKQHTPIIHFQPDQEGATLRATELKPKLDKFIAEHLEKLNPELYKEHIKVIEAFFVIDKEDKKQVAAPYKLKVLSRSDPKESYVISSYLSRKQMDLLRSKQINFIAPSLYFAQEKEINALFRKEWISGRNETFLVDDYEDKLSAISRKGLVAKDQKVELEFFSFHDRVRVLIAYALPYVLILENFGTRQNKAFGCFYLENKSLEDFEVIIKELIKTRIITAAYKSVDSYSEYTKIYDVINEDYKLLKSGINNNQGYAKSLLFRYFCEAQQGSIRWEKRTIKQQIGASTHRDFRNPLKQTKSDPVDCGERVGWNDLSQYSYKYVRALLGLAEQFEFQVDGNRGQEKYIVTVASKEENKIDRFKSPLTFKVFNGQVYILAFQEPIKLITNKLFGLTLKKKKNNGEVVRTDLNDIRTPENFSIEHFLDKTINTRLAMQNSELGKVYQKI